MRNLLLATAAVAMLGAAATSRADSVDLALGDMEVITAGAYTSSYRYPDFHFNFSKHGDIDFKKYVDVYADFYVHPRIYGNYADGEAAATAYGENTFTETLSFGDTVEGYMSKSGSHAIAASAPPYYKPHRPPQCCDVKGRY